VLHVLDVAKANPSLHKSIPHIDWSRAALLGHSMGGNQIMAAAANANASYNLKAIVASHGVSDGAAGKLTMPAMFESSDDDRTVWPSRVKSAFDACPSRPKVFAQAKGRGHMEPEQDGVVNPFMAHFVGCEVAGLKTSCDKVYGSGPDSMCHDTQNISSCVVTKSQEVMV
jgi:pimeloyl-ACP methyl ester carboxylesterase